MLVAKSTATAPVPTTSTATAAIATPASILRICTLWRTGATARLLLIALRALHRRRWAWWRGFFSSRCALCIVAAGLGGAASSHRAARSASSPLGLVARLLLIALRALHRRRANHQ